MPMLVEGIDLNSKRPVLRWHGGKWRIAPWIISQFPQHRIYTEAFGGAASVLIQKPRAYGEVYNDLDEDVVNLFRVLQRPSGGRELERRLRLTPFARKEFEKSYQSAKEPIERARRLIIRAFMGFGSNGHNSNRSTGFRANSNRSGTTPAHDWNHYPNYVRIFTERLQGVVIECRPAIEIILQQDSQETLHYVDPPYVHSTRTDDSPDYNFEMTDNDHCELASVLNGLKGMVVLSGYESDLYSNLFKDWKKITRRAIADGGRTRIEVLYVNHKAAEKNKDLF